MTAGEEMRDGLDFDLNGSSYRANGWGRPRPSGHPGNEPIPWLHSDIKNMAYYYAEGSFNPVPNDTNLEDIRMVRRYNAIKRQEEERSRKSRGIMGLFGK